jgi:hypothetical protein
MKYVKLCLALVMSVAVMSSQAQNQAVKLVKAAKDKRIDVFIGGKPFTSFLYPDTLEKSVLYPIIAANGTEVTRGFPLNTKAGDATDHPHHIGLWFNYENVNGLDFWNNSYAIPKDKKAKYGWIKTDKILQLTNGAKGLLAYHANWTNQKNDVLLEETTRFEFSGDKRNRIIDRVTTLTAQTEVDFNDAKDGMLGLRLAHELQIPAVEDQKFTDDKGNVTIIKGVADKIANGNYLTSEGIQGDAAWSTRGKWCKVYGKIGADSVSVAIIDHVNNPNYPTFWHARGYGLFAANPLGEKIFTNGKSAKNLHLEKGESVTFRYRILVTQGNNTATVKELNAIAQKFTQLLIN